MKTNVSSWFHCVCSEEWISSTSRLSSGSCRSFYLTQHRPNGFLVGLNEEIGWMTSAAALLHDKGRRRGFLCPPPIPRAPPSTVLCCLGPSVITISAPGHFQQLCALCPPGNLTHTLKQETTPRLQTVGANKKKVFCFNPSKSGCDAGTVNDHKRPLCTKSYLDLHLLMCVRILLYMHHASHVTLIS